MKFASRWSATVLRRCEKLKKSSERGRRFAENTSSFSILSRMKYNTIMLKEDLARKEGSDVSFYIFLRFINDWKHARKTFHSYFYFLYCEDSAPMYVAFRRFFFRFWIGFRRILFCRPPCLWSHGHVMYTSLCVSWYVFLRVFVDCIFLLILVFCIFFIRWIDE